MLHDSLRLLCVDLLQPATTLLLVESEMRGSDLRQKQKFHRNIIGVSVYMLILCCSVASIQHGLCALVCFLVRSK